MARTKKSKVKWVTAGATFVVEDQEGREHKFGCSGARENQSPDELLKTIKDCIEQKITATSSKGRK